MQSGCYFFTKLEEQRCFMKRQIKIFGYFTVGEVVLWGLSQLFILLSFFLFDGKEYLTLASSLLGTTSLIFCAKGNPIGQLLMLIFSAFYGFISWGFAYYGEMITYLGMTAPMAAFSLVAWLKNPYKGNKAEVKVARLSAKEIVFAFLLTGLITFAFYFILQAFDTANLLPSTLSVSTSFLAVYLTFRRSPYYALAYAANDIVLIALWLLAVLEDIGYLSVLVCFVVFLVNDLYGFFNWLRMRKAQEKTEE